MSDATAVPDAAGMHGRMEDQGLGRQPASPPPASSLTTANTTGGGGAATGPLWLVVYDRVSRIRFRLQMEDPLFLTIIGGTVMPVFEADESLPYELHEFVTLLDAYECERLQLAAAARRGHASSNSFATMSGGVTSVSNGSVHRGAGSTHSDPATAAAAAAAASFSLGSAAASMAGASGVASGSGVLSNGSLGGGGGPNHHPAGTAPAPPPRKVEETLRRTLEENSDFFFRLASVAYDLDPTTHGISPYAPSAGAGATAASAGTGTAAGVAAAGLPNSSVGAGVNGRGEGIPTSTAGVVASLLAGTIAATAATVVAATNPPLRRNYAVHSGYSAAFHLCSRLFGAVYRDNCQALAQKIAHGFSALRVEDCVKFRKAVWTGFHLKALDPYRSGARSESNLELRWVSEKIKEDQHLFPARCTAPQPHSSHVSRLVDATLSYVANARRRAQPGSGRGSSSSANGGGAGVADGAAGGAGGAGRGGAGGAAAADAEENEMLTYGLTKLLQSPSWQKDEDCSDTCRSCGRAFISVSRPLGARAHHCRSCGVRRCVFCITKRAHFTFAKLAKPGSSDETEERLVCDTCYKEYDAVSQLHYLGALFAFSGLGFSDLVLCRTVNEQWREAAELCISEYRLLLHNCDADLHSVKTPVGILLQNSLFLLLGDGPAPSVPVVHHPEAALLLLKFIATENLWVPDASYYFILRLSSAVLNRADTVLTQLPTPSSASPVLASPSTNGGAATGRHRGFRLPVVPTFSHWHLFCTAFCSQIASSYFFIKCAEHLCAAPVKVYDAYVGAALERMTSVYLSTAVLWRRLAEANRACAAAFAARASGAAASGPLQLPLLSDVTEGQVVTLWLLDMLHKDALVPPQRRRYQQVLERVIPTVAGASLSLVFVMLLSLQSTYSYYRYDEDLFGSWRARIVAEVGRRDAHARDRVLATLDFFNELDHFCAQSAVVSQASVVEWIIGYCTRGAAAAGATAALPRRGLPPKRIDLPRPMLNPFKPYMIVKSIRLTGVRVAPNAASKPTWLAFSTWTTAEHEAIDAAERAPPAEWSSPPSRDSATVNASIPILPPSPLDTTSSEAGASGSTPGTSAFGAAPQECMFLYKRENVERDQLMCISSRLLQTLLASEIGNAEMMDYSVLPLSCDSGLIEKAEGRELSNLDNMDISRYVLHRGPQGCVNFLASAKLFLLLNYIFSIGDRHKGNVLIGTSGALLHIDFRFIFSEKTFVEKLARSTVRIDDAFLAAVEQCQQWQGGSAGAVGVNATAPCGQAACAASPSLPPLPPLAAPAGHRVTPPRCSPSTGDRRGSGGASGANNAGAARSGPAEPSSAEIREAFFSSAAEWFVHVRPHAAVFYELWLYAVHRHTVPYNEAELLNMLNTLFDRHASQTSSASKFSTTMKESVNVCRLKDVTHSSAEVLRFFADQVSRRFSGGSVDAVKKVGTIWNSWWSRSS